jgi:hypothetical protein
MTKKNPNSIQNLSKLREENKHVCYSYVKTRCFYFLTEHVSSRPGLAIRAWRAPALWSAKKFNTGLTGKVRLRRKTGPPLRNDIARRAAACQSGPGLVWITFFVVNNSQQLSDHLSGVQLTRPIIYLKNI